jgi:NDP-sugar pyrophosphorylase family protein
MAEIGGRASLLHILENYSDCGLHDLEVCLGYRGYVIKAHFVT